MSVYSSRIRAARGYAGLSQVELAERLGVEEQTIKRRESPSGKEPKPGERIAIAVICDVPVEFLEMGFGTIATSEIAERLERIEAALGSLGSTSSGAGLERELEAERRSTQHIGDGIEADDLGQTGEAP